MTAKNYEGCIINCSQNGLCLVTVCGQIFIPFSELGVMGKEFGNEDFFSL